MNEEKKIQFFKMPMKFFDYGLQVFTHCEFDILQYILRNTIGWRDEKDETKHKLECDLSIKNMALMKHYSEKNIIKAINNLIEKTGVFNKIVYYEKGSCLKKTKYIITENSVKILNDYVEQNIPAEFETKKEMLKNRTIKAMERLEKGKQDLIEKQKSLLEFANNEKFEKQNETDNSLLEAWREIINDYDEDNLPGYIYSEMKENESLFKHWKEDMYKALYWDIPQEENDEKIDIRLSDLIKFTDNLQIIDFYNSLIKQGKMKGGQKNYFLNSLKINFGIKNTRNFDRINIIYK